MKLIFQIAGFGIEAELFAVDLNVHFIAAKHGVDVPLDFLGNRCIIRNNCHGGRVGSGDDAAHFLRKIPAAAPWADHIGECQIECVIRNACASGNKNRIHGGAVV